MKAIANLLQCKISIFILIFASTSCFADEINLASNEMAVEQSIATLILHDIYTNAGLRAKTAQLPAARANALALSGKVDGEVARIQAYADKNPSLLQVRPAYYYLETVAYAKTNLKISDKKSLGPYRVGVVRGVAHAETAAAYASKVEIVGTYEQLFRMLEAGRIDVAIDTGVNGAKTIKQLGLKNTQPVATFARLELFHILHEKNRHIAETIGREITAMKRNGELDKLIKKYETQVINNPN